MRRIRGGKKEREKDARKIEGLIKEEGGGKWEGRKVWKEKEKEEKGIRKNLKGEERSTKRVKEKNGDEEFGKRVRR